MSFSLPRQIGCIVAAVGTLCVFNACESGSGEKLPGAVQVIPTGSVLRMRNENGSIEIEAMAEETRRYTWNRNVLVSNLKWRTYKENGAFGLHSNEGTPLFGGNPKLITDESSIQFLSLAEARKWTDESGGLKWVANRDGWLVGYVASDFHPRYLRVEVFRAYVGGKLAQIIPDRKSAFVQIGKSNARREVHQGQALKLKKLLE